MIKTVLTTAFVACSLVALPLPALAGPQDDFRHRCEEAGGTYADGTCKYADGSTEQCAFSEDDWACYRDNPPQPARLKNTGKLVNIPVKIVKMPIPPGPVETATTISKARPSASSTSESFTTTSRTATPSVKLTVSAKTTTLRLRKN